MRFTYTAFYYPFFFSLLVFIPLLAQFGEDISLGSIIAPKPKVLGIDPDASPAAAEEALKSMGIFKSAEKKFGPFVRSYVYDGIPEGLWVQQGETTLSFVEEQLMRIDLSLEATYENFLLLKEQLFASLGERFTIEQSKEAIDDFLKSHLASLAPGEYSERTEEEIQQALQRGNTFFHYVLADSRNELKVIISFYAPKDSQGYRKPNLILHYGFVQPLEELELMVEASKTKILPE